jgi:hypothetical protein
VPSARSVVAGAGRGGDTHGVGGMETIIGATVGEGCSGLAHAGEGSPSGESCTGDGDCRIGEDASSGVGSRGVRAGERGMVLRE